MLIFDFWFFWQLLVGKWAWPPRVPLVVLVIQIRPQSWPTGGIFGPTAISKSCFRNCEECLLTCIVGAENSYFYCTAIPVCQKFRRFTRKIIILLIWIRFIVPSAYYTNPKSYCNTPRIVQYTLKIPLWQVKADHYLINLLTNQPIN